MCGRYALRANLEEIARILGLADPPDDIPAHALPPRYNIAPTQTILVCRASETGAPALVPMRFGLVPSWSRDLKMGVRLLNARRETVAEKPAFRTAFRRRRCLVPADGWYEWKKITDPATAKPAKQPWLLERDGVFCLAGLHERWIDRAAGDGEGSVIESFCILTTAAAQLAAEVHDRMPVVVPESAFDTWLTAPAEDADDILAELLAASGAGAHSATPVSRHVSNARNEDARCVEPIGEPRSVSGLPSK